MKPKIRMILLCTVAAFMLPTLAVAGNIYCRGAVDDVYVTGTGGVFAKGEWRGTWTQFCNLDEEWKGISTSTCFGFYNQLVTIQREQLKAVVNYNNTSESCTSMPAYSNAEAPNYIMIRRED